MKTMKKTRKIWSIIGMLLILSAMAAGCAGDGKDSEAEDTPAPVIYPVTIDGTEIRVGETTVQALLDKGLKVTVSEMTADKNIQEYEIDPNEVLEANSYYSGGSVWITDSTFAHVAMVTGEEDTTMGNAVIAYMEISLSGTDQTGLDKILFNGVPVTEISREKAGEMFPDFTGDENMWFSPATMLDYNYFMGFDADGMLMKFSVKKVYDVDWNSNN